MSEPPTSDLELNPDEAPETIESPQPEPVFPEYHQWKQDGPWLRCHSCPQEHGSYIGVDRQLIGVTEKGEPVLIDL